VTPDDRPEIDYRFSLANERTFLSWIRTSLALLAGGIAAAKALNFDHETWRWLIATPPIVAGALLAAQAPARRRRYEEAMRSGRPLPAGRGMAAVGLGLAVYAVVALIAAALDG
jgi:putative membrane protein